MSAMSATGVSGPGIAINDEQQSPVMRIVASDYVVGSSVITVLFQYSLKNGVDSYNVFVTSQNPLPVDDSQDFSGDNHTFNITKLDDRWARSEDTWIYDANAAPGRMKGFVIHSNGNVGGGEGSRDTRFMWMVVSTGYDLSAFVV